jgi:hypothetical protein
MEILYSKTKFNFIDDSYNNSYDEKVDLLTNNIKKVLEELKKIEK